MATTGELSMGQRASAFANLPRWAKWTGAAAAGSLALASCSGGSTTGPGIPLPSWHASAPSSARPSRIPTTGPELDDAAHQVGAKLAQLAAQQCNQTFQAYQAGKIKPQPDRHSGRSDLRLSIGERAMVVAVYNSRKGETLKRADCRNDFGLYRFTEAAKRGKYLTHEEPKQWPDGTKYIAATATHISEGTHWEVTADNGVDLPLLGDKPQTGSFTVPEHPGEKVKDGLGKVEEVVISGALTIAELILRAT